MSTDILDDLTVLQVDMAAVSACMNRSDYDPLLVPGEQMTDNDYRAGVREVFADMPEWEEWMVEPLLVEVKRARAARLAVDGILDAIMFRSLPC